VDKVDTTIALTPEVVRTRDGRELLGEEWLGRWSRSGAKFPSDVPAEGHAAFEETIRSHPQFRGA
jgi:hypothetical protein